MVVIIKDLKLPNDSYSFLDTDERINVLKNLSKVNIFVGENNSGKSLLMRKIFFEENLKFLPTNGELKNLNKAILEIKKRYKDYCENRFSYFPKTSVGRYVEPELKDIQNIDFLVMGEDSDYYLNKLFNLMDKLKNEDPKTSQYNISFKQMGENIISIINDSFEDNGLSIDKLKLNYYTKNIYIPILRGLRPLNYGNDSKKNLSNLFFEDIYEKRTVEDYFEGKKELNIFSGLRMYEILNELKNGDYSERIVIEEFEEYLGKNFFDNQKVSLTPYAKEKGEIIVKIGDETEKRIYELGDGIQSIIILTFPIFSNNIELEEKSNILVFIEEPEHLLHPALQRKFMETILDSKKFPNFQFFFTTHSNHFLDITLDFNNISIFTFEKNLEGAGAEKNPKFTVKKSNHGDGSLLDILGVRNSSVFLSNCHIVVEGITDAIYLKHYLDLYQNHMESQEDNFRKFKEDYHYSFIEVGGSNIKHFYEDNKDNFDLERIYGRVFLIMDSDDLSESEISDIEEILKEKLNEDFHILQCREIENLLTKETLIKILKNDKKFNGYKLDESFEYKNYKNQRLTSFIKETIFDGELDFNPIGNKRKFCNKSKKYVNNWENLSSEAQEISEKIYKFIEKQNNG